MYVCVCVCVCVCLCLRYDTPEPEPEKAIRWMMLSYQRESCLSTQLRRLTVASPSSSSVTLVSEISGTDRWQTVHSNNATLTTIDLLRLSGGM